MGEIRRIRKGSVKLNEEDRLKIGELLLKAGYTVKIDYQPIPGSTKNQKEHVIVFEE